MFPGWQCVSINICVVTLSVIFRAPPLSSVYYVILNFVSFSNKYSLGTRLAGWGMYVNMGIRKKVVWARD